jgi:hypothetical protein
VIESQVDTLTLTLFFCHGLCFKYSNGSCKPIFDIYVSKYFEWYKEIFNPMSFDPWIPFWKFGSPPRPQLPRCKFIPSLSYIPWMWNVILGLPYRPTPLQTLALVTSPMLRSWQYPNEHNVAIWKHPNATNATHNWCNSWLLMKIAITMFTNNNNV